MSVRILTDFGTKAKKTSGRSVGDACSSMAHGIISHRLNKMEKYLHRAEPNSKTHSPKVDGSRRRMSFNLRQDYSYATTNTDINVSRLSRPFSLMNTFNQFCFRKRTISCGYPYTKTLILTFFRHFRFFFLSLTIYLTQLSGNSLLIM